jgi:hypothetical protein
LFRKANKTCNVCLDRDKRYHAARDERRLLEAAKAGARALLEIVCLSIPPHIADGASERMLIPCHQFPTGLPVGLTGAALSDAIAAAGMAAMAAAPAVTRSPVAAADPGIMDHVVGLQGSAREQSTAERGVAPLNIWDLNPVARGDRPV